jgi:hypothetical protein
MVLHNESKGKSFNQRINRRIGARIKAPTPFESKFFLKSSSCKYSGRTEVFDFNMDRKRCMLILVAYFLVVNKGKN